jgi:hypothetical protein
MLFDHLRRFSMKKIYLLIALIMVANGCTIFKSNIQKQNDDMLQLRKQVAHYMMYRKTENIQEVYQMMSSDFRRKFNFSEYQKMPMESTTGLIHYYINSIELKDQEHAVVLITEYAHLGGAPSFMLLPDQKYEWIKEKGVWYLHKELNTEAPSFNACGQQRHEEGESSVQGNTNSNSECGN